MSPSCAPSCAISAPATATWTRVRCGPTSTYPCGGRLEGVRHALRDQERQFHSLHRPGHRLRGASADRDPGGRRHDRPGDPPLRPRQGRDALHALEEEAHDYATSPIPIFCRSNSNQAYVDALAAEITELPDAKKTRLVEKLGLSAYDASILVSEKAIADYFEKVAEGRDGKTAANWVINDLLGALNKAGKSIEDAPVAPDQLGAIRPHQGGHDLRQDRQGSVRDRPFRRRRPALRWSRAAA